MTRTIPVTLQLDPMIVVLLQAIATHTGRTKDEVVAEGLRLLFAVLPRPGDTAPLERDHEIEASKSGGAT